MTAHSLAIAVLAALTVITSFSLGVLTLAAVGDWIVERRVFTPATCAWVGNLVLVWALIGATP